jgi:hypothetical protein
MFDANNKVADKPVSGPKKSNYKLKIVIGFLGVVCLIALSLTSLVIYYRDQLSKWYVSDIL